MDVFVLSIRSDVLVIGEKMSKQGVACVRAWTLYLRVMHSVWRCLRCMKLYA